LTVLSIAKYIALLTTLPVTEHVQVAAENVDLYSDERCPVLF